MESVSISVNRTGLSRLVVLFVASAFAAVASSQDRLPLMPHYEDYVKAQREIGLLVGALGKGAPAGFRWIDGGKSAVFQISGKWKKFDFSSKQLSESDQPKSNDSDRQRRNPGRGRQFDEVFSKDGNWVARHVAGNVVLEEIKKKTKTNVTADGGKNRIKYGTGSWVYGEELDQREAMWFSPDSSMLAYYKFDESKVLDYHLTVDQGEIQDALYTEAYPKAGAPNPVVALQVYDLKSKKTSKIDVRFDSGFDKDMGHYAYAVRWLPGDRGLLYFRMNRLQNKLEVVLANPKTGAQKVVIRDENPTGWVEYRPGNIWDDSGDEINEFGSKLIFISEKTGFRNIYLYDLNGNEKQLTDFKFEVQSILKYDSKAGKIWFVARSSANPTHLQLHRINADGTGLVQLTESGFSHRVQLAPDGNSILDRASTWEQPTSTRLLDGEGKVLSEFTKGDASSVWAKGYSQAQRFECLANDGTSKITGYYRVPKNFDPTKKYPLLVDVYGGPGSGTSQEDFLAPDPRCELGFITAWIDGRGTNGKGRAYRQSVYQKLGIFEIDDQATAAKYLATKPFIDGTKVGINGTSYGGYASAMAILRYPDVFAAASASSAVTQWKNYDSIYTERFMSTPQLNPKGYEEGSAMKYAKNLEGRLLLFYGTADDNVHPSNTYQLIKALDQAGKSYELAVGVDQGHSGVNSGRMLEFFIDALILDTPGKRKN